MSAANNVNPPVVFTQDELGWVSWIDPLPEAELTERHFAGLVDRSRSKSEYFRLLVRDPEVLEARTKTDKDIFYNVADGLPVEAAYRHLLEISVLSALPSVLVARKATFLAR